MKKYMLYVRKYNFIANDYIFVKFTVLTDDIYHFVGEYYLNSLEEIKRIYYKEIK